MRSFFILVFLATALAGDVREALPGGYIDWTASKLVVEASGVSNTGAWKDVRAIEQSAFLQLEPRVEELARQVRFSGDAAAGDLLGDAGPVADSLEEGLGSWTVVETRYYQSGKVELRAELPLQAWLRPALLSQAAGPPPAEGQRADATGLVVDARGLDLRPALAPRLLAPDEQVLYAIATLTEEAAALSTPVVWTSEPSDAVAIKRAGDKPLFVRATSVVGGSDLVLDREDAARVRAVAANSAILSSAKVVVVVDP